MKTLCKILTFHINFYTQLLTLLHLIWDNFKTKGCDLSQKGLHQHGQKNSVTEVQKDDKTLYVT